MITLQEVLDLQAQCKITITIAQQAGTRYATLRAYTENAEKYYVNDYCLSASQMHQTNKTTLSNRLRALYPNTSVMDSILIIEGRLFTHRTLNYMGAEEVIMLIPFDGQEFISMTKKGRQAYSGDGQVQHAVYRLVFSTDRYPLGAYRTYGKPRKYRKSEIQTSNLSQEMKDELCQLHDKYFVLFSQDGEYIGLYPRHDNYRQFEITPETIEYLNATLAKMYGENVFVINFIKYDEKLVTEGVALC